MPVLYLILAASSFYIVYNRIKNDVLHPVAILTSIWFITAAISSLQWGSYQHEWSIGVHVMIISSGMICWLAGYLAIRRVNSIITIDKPINDSFRIITRMIFVVSLLFVIMVFLKNGMNLSYLKNVGGADLKTEVGDNLTGISSLESYMINLFPFCAIFSFFEIMYAEKEEKKYLYNITVIALVFLYCLRALYSRGTLLYLLLGFLFIFNSKRKIPIRILALSLIGVLVLLGIVMGTRVYSGSVVFMGVKHVRNPIIASAYNYIAYSFENFSIIAERGSRYQIFANVFQSVYKLIGLYKPNQVIANEVAGVFNSLTWLSPFYDDLGAFGVILYPGLISFFLAKCYNKSQYNKYYILVLAVMQKAVFVTFFGNYFLTTLSVMLPYIVTGLLCFFARRVVIRVPKFKMRLKR